VGVESMLVVCRTGPPMIMPMVKVMSPTLMVALMILALLSMVEP
jgi:hypothetical protein